MKKIIFVVSLFAITMISISIAQLATAQQGLASSIKCPQGHSCQCDTSTGIGTDLTTGYSINNKCNNIASQVGSGWTDKKPI